MNPLAALIHIGLLALATVVLIGAWGYLAVYLTRGSTWGVRRRRHDPDVPIGDRYPTQERWR